MKTYTRDGEPADRVPDDAERAAAALRDRHTQHRRPKPPSRGRRSRPATADRSRSAPDSARPSTCGWIAAAKPAWSTSVGAGTTAARPRPARVWQRARRSGRDSTPRSRRARRAHARRPATTTSPVRSTRPRAASAPSNACTSRIATWCWETAAAPPDRAISIRTASRPAATASSIRARPAIIRAAPPAPVRSNPTACWGSLRHAHAGLGQHLRGGVRPYRSSSRCMTTAAARPARRTRWTTTALPSAVTVRSMWARSATSASPRSRPAHARRPATTARRAPRTSSPRSAARPPPAPPDYGAALGRRLLPRGRKRKADRRPLDRHRLPAGLREPRRRTRRDLRWRLPDQLPARTDASLRSARLPARRAGRRRGDLLGPLRGKEETFCQPDPGRCCPAGCTAAEDPDCSLRCGNGAIDFTSGEMCDTGAPPGDPSSSRRPVTTRTDAPTICWSAREPAARCVSTCRRPRFAPGTVAVRTAPTSSSIPTARRCAATASSRTGGALRPPDR